MSSPDDVGCAVQRLLHAEPLAGTAPEAAAAWLLLEHAGPWPAKGLPADLPVAVRDVVEAARARGVRPQLVRPVADRRRPPTLLAVASVRPEDRWLEVRHDADPRALLDLDLDALAEGRAPGFGTPTPGPLVLVCTHGKRDVCCARRGRPLAVALDPLLPGRVFETDHLGGDRFAPNVLTLPWGTYHGGGSASDAPALAAAALAAEVVVPRLRGTAGRPAAQQAAECFVREATGLTGLDDVRALSVTSGEGGRVDVDVRAGGALLRVALVRSTAVAARLTTCSAGGTTDRPSSHALVAPVTGVPVGTAIRAPDLAAV